MVLDLQGENKQTKNHLKGFITKEGFEKRIWKF